MNWTLGASVALALVAFAPLAVAEDMIGKGPVVIKAVPESGQAAENVARVESLDKTEESTHLFSVTGGDPAINGEYVFLDVSPEDMSQEDAIFQVGDFNSWEILEQTKDHVVLKISRSWVDDPTGEIKSTEEKWTVPMVKSTAQELTITVAK
ncbi:hypothetical protein sos41_22820 [Alphaproteobacteria bacterium SO-S41]|nr:hypothetical protein sos41_22820 [Alphaproteobacteria bacterium SO-S41]